MPDAGLVDRIGGLMVTAALRQGYQREGDEAEGNDRSETPTRLAPTGTCQDGQILDARPGFVDQIRQCAGAGLDGALPGFYDTLSGFYDTLQGTRHLNSLRFLSLVH